MKTFEIGTGADVLTVSEDRLNEVVRQGREAVRQARGAGEVPPDALQGKPAAMLVALAGFGDLMTALQWRHLGGIVARDLAKKTPAGFSAYRRWVTASETQAIATDPKLSLVIERLGSSPGVPRYIWRAALRRRQEEAWRRAVAERKLREERRRQALMPGITAAVAWHAQVTKLLDDARTHQRWISAEAQDALAAARPKARLRDQVRKAGAEHLLTRPQRAGVAFADADLSQLVRETNEAVVVTELQKRRRFFDTIERTPLTEEQARAVICFDNRVQVLAAAGSGKTSVMVARAAYAVSRGFVRADRILLLAFNRNAAKELQERIEARFAAAGIETLGVRASTFHSLGLSVIGLATGKKPRRAPWLESGEDLKVVSTIVEELRDRSETFRYQWDLYRLLFAHAPVELEEHRPDGWSRDKREAGYQTFGGAVVKSHGERMVADFLYLNGVDYEYEHPYSHPVATADHSQYRPDFYYPDIEVWHEHWALGRDGKPPSAFANYAEGMAWKRKTHAQYKTTLLETNWAEVVLGNGLADLARKLTEAGLTLNWNPDRPHRNLASKPMKHADLARLIRAFMAHVKSNSWTRAKLEKRLSRDLRQLAGYRTQLFLDIYWPIHEAWERRLAEDGVVDYEDMITQAANYLETGAIDMGFDLVMVDEFQDVSQAGARLVRGLLRRPGRYLLAVGDDWQSINRFAGADLSVMTDFESWFGRGCQLALTTTFRCPQTVCTVATRFVAKNPAQLDKPMRSSRTMRGSPINIVFTEQPREALAQYLAELSEKASAGAVRVDHVGKVVVNVLGRYRADRDLMPSRYPANIDLTFRTIHSSKGLEADYIVVPGLTNGNHGFPSDSADDPVLDLAMPSPETFRQAEERRLFYVAMTRAREEVTLIASQQRMSAFVAELLQNPGDDVKIVGAEGAPVSICRACREGVLVQRQSEYGSFLGCTNWPRCAYTLALPQAGGIGR